MQKIVFNAHYLMYFDTAVSEYWRGLALPYEEAMHLLDGELYVKKASIEFHGSARMDDQLDVALRCARVGNSSMLFEGAIFRGDRLLITGELLYVFADPATQTSRPVPQALRDILAAYEAGESMTSVRTGTWTELRAEASALRTRVFVEEQGVPQDLEWDEWDEGAVHALATNRLGQVVGTGRLLRSSPGVGKIGRVAVHPGLRGSGIGRELMASLMSDAAARGDQEMLLHAQCSAESFYRRLGFVSRGERFEEAGIAHVEMAVPLAGAAVLKGR